MRTVPSPARTPEARRLAWWQVLAMLPTIYRAERSKVGRPGHEGRAARTVLAFWGVGIVAGLVIAILGVLTGRPELVVSGVVLTVVSVPLPIVNVLVVPGWKLWKDSAGESAIVTSPRGNLSGFWSTTENALGLGLAVVVRVPRHRGRGGYRPRSARHARAYAASVTRIGATATPKNETNPLGWWDVALDEATGQSLSNVVIRHPNGRSRSSWRSCSRHRVSWSMERVSSRQDGSTRSSRRDRSSASWPYRFSERCVVSQWARDHSEPADRSVSSREMRGRR